jgi:hypothetical protein
MVTRDAWSLEKDAELKRLAERGYTIMRLSIRLKRSPNFVNARAKALGVPLKKPQRLPCNERGFGAAVKVSAMRRGLLALNH